MAQLVIKGHHTRGNEVIASLEMLGGKNTYNLKGDEKFAYYTIDRDGEIRGGIYIFSDDENENIVSFTLEIFEDKFPYKVGDKVKTIYDEISIVKQLVWSNKDNAVKYELEVDEGIFYFANELQPYKEEIMENKSNLLHQLKDYFDNTPREVVEKEWHEYDKYNEISPKVNEYLEYVNNIRHPKYPNTYDECIKVLMGETDFHLFGFVPTFRDVNGNFDNEINPYSPYINVVNEFFSLLICRDDYWKIAGKELNLGKPWKPVWDESEDLYTIHTFNGEIRLSGTSHRNAILAFPTEEMRDTFYDNFKDLIEKCKELL